MKFVEKIQQNYEPEQVLFQYTGDRTPYFFDIETTGLSGKVHYAYLIGAMTRTDEGWLFRQWMAENADEEAEMLRRFNETLSPEYVLIHYNGSTFDIPFLNERFRTYGLVSNLPDPKDTIDLYRMLMPVGKCFHTANCKQTSMELLSGYPRTDCFTGQELVKTYAEYVARCRFDAPRAEELLHDLLLHNYDDIMGLADIPKLLHYLNVSECEMRFVSADVSGEDYATFTVSVSFDFPKEFRKAIPLPEIPYDCVKKPNGSSADVNPAEDLFLSVAMVGNQIKVVAPIYKCSAYYYYPNYKDYYYLPLENMAVHKSLGASVDKKYREPATKDTARQIHSGPFLPQISEVVAPAFRFRHNDRMSLFACHCLTEEHTVALVKSWLAFFDNLGTGVKISF